MKLKGGRMFSGTRRYNKFDIATGQLETAIRLFVIEGCDMFSALTLAGAAGAILHQLVVDAGKEPFVDYTARIFEWKHDADRPARSKVISHIHRLLSINAVKHHDPNQDQMLETDAEECALAAILKAIADYKTLTGTQTEAMKAMFGWVYKNMEKEDSDELMKQYEAVPAKLKPVG